MPFFTATQYRLPPVVSSALMSALTSVTARVSWVLAMPTIAMLLTIGTWSMIVGADVGANVRVAVGVDVADGMNDGIGAGAIDGADVGTIDGARVGATVGALDGPDVGNGVGAVVGKTGVVAVNDEDV